MRRSLTAKYYSRSRGLGWIAPHENLADITFTSRALSPDSQAVGRDVPSQGCALQRNSIGTDLICSHSIRSPA
jgi:hypothetical protein